MNTYTVRIELHSGDFSFFILLHSEMAKKGFSRTITADGGIVYQLPRAEYSISTSGTKSQVLAAAESAVKAVGKTAEILVTQSAGRTWSGLAEVK